MHKRLKKLFLGASEILLSSNCYQFWLNKLIKILYRFRSFFMWTQWISYPWWQQSCYHTFIAVGSTYADAHSSCEYSFIYKWTNSTGFHYTLQTAKGLNITISTSNAFSKMTKIPVITPWKGWVTQWTEKKMQRQNSLVGQFSPGPTLITIHHHHPSSSQISYVWSIWYFANMFRPIASLYSGISPMREVEPILNPEGKNWSSRGK